MRDLSFLPRTKNIASGITPAAAAARRFEPIERHSNLGDDEVFALRALVESPDFPCSETNVIGRSVYAITHPSSHWRQNLGIHGVKLKGAFGLSASADNEADSPLELVLPSPTVAFHEKEHWHIRLDENLRLTSVASAPKGLNTLGLKGALQEMACHNALSACGVALPGILAGELKRGESPILDLNGERTGAVFIQHDPTTKDLWGYMAFLYTELSDYEAEIRLPVHGDFKLQGDHPLVELVSNYCRFMGRLGEIKSRAMIDAGVVRHSSHPGNFLYHEGADQIFQTDNDTCLRSMDMPPELRGAQLLRDVCTTMQRLIIDLSMYAYSPDWLDLMKQFDPFHCYLTGVFKRFVDDDTISECSQRLCSRLVSFNRSRSKEFLMPLANRYRQAVRANDGAVKNDLTGRWAFIHNPFLADSIRSVYEICRVGRFPSDIKVSLTNERSFHQELIEGINELRGNILGRQQIEPTNGGGTPR